MARVPLSLPVEIHIQPSFKAFLWFNFYVQYRSCRFLVWISTLLLALTLFALCAGGEFDSVQGVPGYLIPLFLPFCAFVVIPLATLYSAKKHYASSNKVHEPRAIT